MASTITFRRQVSRRGILSAVRRLSMGLSRVCHAPLWVAFGWMLFLAQRRTSGGSRSGSRSPTSTAHTMHSYKHYLKMKLPGPNGIITITGDFRKSLECTSAGGNLADSLVIAEEKRQLKRVVAMAQAQ